MPRISRKNIDELDKKILILLQKDSRKTYAEIAKNMNLSETAVRNRIKKLIRNKIIKKFTVFLDIEKIGKGIMALIGVKIGGEIGPVAASKLINFSEVTDIYTVTGEFDLILKVICNDIRHLESVIEKIRALDFTNETRSFVVLNRFKEYGEILI
jgi:Lrp/AsnC family transcriptional regulator for asnA, asnC and gidA